MSFAVRTRDGTTGRDPRRARTGRESGATTARPPAPCRPQASLTGDSADAAWPPARCPPAAAHPRP